ncbi:hypothetical protein WJX81_002857 [Elliptochloris bilobata]|uniref:Uncharacterized protein n=1 Tax=Elliptochloris bilobata TaxID=381761 RepID=A0AAW1SCT1_9CHLO
MQVCGASRARSVACMVVMSLVSGFAGSRQCLAGGSVSLDRAVPLRRVCSRPSVVRATATTEEQTDDNRPKLTFGANANAARGYTEEDSAGQSNIFAVEPKQYVQGSVRDSGGPSSNVGAVVAGVVAIGIVVAGLVALSKGGSSSKIPAPLSTVQDEASSFRSLSTFKQQFGTAPPVASTEAQ